MRRSNKIRNGSDFETSSCSCRAGRVPAVRPFAAACDAVGWSPSAKTFAWRVKRSWSWRASRARTVECRSWRGRRERISLLLCSPGPHGPTAIDCPGNVPQSIAVLPGRASRCCCWSSVVALHQDRLRGGRCRAEAKADHDDPPAAPADHFTGRYSIRFAISAGS